MSPPARLHLGCGTRILPGYVNIDRHQVAEGVENLDILDLPYASGSIDAILAEHLAEHLGFADEERFFRECHRLLRPGGTLVVETPDLEWVCREFLAAQDDFKAFYIVGSPDHYFGNGRTTDQRWSILTTMFFGNQNGDGQFHRNGYTAGKLHRIAELVGFSRCRVEKPFNKGGQALRAELTK